MGTSIDTVRNYVKQIKEDYKDGRIDDPSKLTELKNAIIEDKKVSQEELEEINDLLKSIDYKESDNDPVSSKITDLFKSISDKTVVSKTQSNILTQVEKLKSIYGKEMDKEFLNTFNQVLKSYGIKGDVRDILLDPNKNETKNILKTLQSNLGLPVTGMLDENTFGEIQKRAGLKDYLNTVMKKMSIPVEIKGLKDNEFTEAIKTLQKELGLPQTGNFKDPAEMENLALALDTELSGRFELKEYLNEVLKGLFGTDAQIKDLSSAELNKAIRTIQQKLGLPETGDFRNSETLKAIGSALDEVMGGFQQISKDRGELKNYINKVFEQVYGTKDMVTDTSDSALAKGIKELQKRLNLPENEDFTNPEVLKKLDEALTNESNKRVLLRNYLNDVLKNTFHSDIQVASITDKDIAKGIETLQKIAGLPQTGKFDDQKTLEDLDKALLKRKVLDALSTKLGIKIQSGGNMSEAIKVVQKELGLPQTGQFTETDQKNMLDEIVSREATMNAVNATLAEQFGSSVKIKSIRTADMKTGIMELQKQLGMTANGDISLGSINTITRNLYQRQDHIQYLNNLFEQAGDSTRISKMDDKTISSAIAKLKDLGYKDIWVKDVVGLEKGYIYDDDIDVKKYIGTYDTIGSARANAYGVSGSHVIVRDLDGRFSLYEVDETITKGEAVGSATDPKIKAMVVEFVGKDDALVQATDDASAWKVLGKDISDFAAQCRENIKISAKWVGGQVRYAAEFYGDLKNSDSTLAQLAGYVGGGILDGVSYTREAIENAEQFYADQVKQGNKTIGYVGGFLTMLASPVKNTAGIADYRLDDAARAKMIEGLGMDVALIVAGGGLLKVGGAVIKGAGKVAVATGKTAINVGKNVIKLGDDAVKFIAKAGEKAFPKLERLATRFSEGVKSVAQTVKKEASWVTEVGEYSIKGMAKASAKISTMVQDDLLKIISKLPKEGKIPEATLKSFINDLKAVAKKYGIPEKDFVHIEKAFFSTADGGAKNIIIKGSKGIQHEIAHAVQLVQNRATALGDAALQKLTKEGIEITDDAILKTVKKLTNEEAEAAFKSIVRPLETQAYGRFEASAFQATGLGGKVSDVARYSEALTEMIKAQGRALTTAVAPIPKVGLGARIYGTIPQVFGAGNKTMALNFSAVIGTGMAKGTGFEFIDDNASIGQNLYRLATMPAQIFVHDYNKYVAPIIGTKEKSVPNPEW